MLSLPGNLVIGGQVRKILDDFLCEFPHVVDDGIRAIGSEAKDAGPKLQNMETFRVTLSIRPRLLSAWASLAHDPGKVAADSVRRGALAGILSQPLLAGVFPLAQLNDGCRGA